jgi:hypothetical protein
MADFDARFNIGDSTPDVIIEKGRYWQDEAIFSAYKLTSGYDSSHYLSFDVNRGPEASGWTLCSTPGTWAIKSGAKTPDNSCSIVMIGENGDISITAENGVIRLKARNIHIDATHNVTDNRNGIVHIKGSEKVSIHAPTVDIDAKRMLKLVSSGNGEFKITNILEMKTGMAKAFTNSSAVKKPVNGMNSTFK